VCPVGTRLASGPGMDRSSRFRTLLVGRLLQAAGLVVVAASTSGCGGDVRCFEWPVEESCPAPNLAAQYMVLCDEDGDCVESVDGPGEREEGECCYDVTIYDDNCGGLFGGCTVEGRPFLVAATPVVAPVVVMQASHAHPIAITPELGPLDAAERALLGERWTRSGLHEHASIASFARVALELMAVGAPAALVAEAHASALDEARHARLCFELASTYRGEQVGAGAFPFGGVVQVSDDLVALAVSTAREGCIGETLAALEAADALAGARDPAVRAVLAAIASDEARHAELSWKIVAWALEAGGEPVRVALARVFASIDPRHPASLGAPVSAALADHGHLDPVTVRSVHARGFSDVVLPCARALLACPAAPHRACVERTATV
jgi:hypothetical protein